MVAVKKQNLFPIECQNMNILKTGQRLHGPERISVKELWQLFKSFPVLLICALREGQLHSVRSTFRMKKDFCSLAHNWKTSAAYFH